MAPVHLCLLLLLLVPIISTTSSTLDAAVPFASLADLPSFVNYQFGRNISFHQNIRNVGYSEKYSFGKWYVYNRRDLLHTEGSFELARQPMPCYPGYSLLLPDKKCFSDPDIQETLCYWGLEPYLNLFGETFCGCGFRAATLLNSGCRCSECHDLFTQGPCDSNSLFVPVNDLVNFGQGQCVPSSCAKLKGPGMKVAEIRLPNGRTDCFFLNTQGPCRENYTFKLVELPEFLGVPHLLCEENPPPRPGLPGGISAVTQSENCVSNNKGKCVLRLKDRPNDPKQVYLETS